MRVASIPFALNQETYPTKKSVTCDETGHVQSAYGRKSTHALGKDAGRVPSRLIFVQESSVPDQHLPPLIYPQVQLRWAWEMVNTNGWGSAVYTNTGAITKVPVAGYAGWVVGVEITGAAWQRGNDHSKLVFSLHATSVAESYAKQVNKILDQIKLIAQGREMK